MRTLVAVMLTVLVAGTTPALADYAWIQWTGQGSNGHWYARTEVPLFWNDAEAAAVAAGGHLVSISSEAENNFVYTTFVVPLNRGHWIGFTDQAVEGTWEWSSGEPVTFTKWIPGEPNNASTLPTGEDHAIMAPSTSTHPGWWADANGTSINVGSEAYAVIEVPEPATLWLLAAGGLAMIRRRH